MLPERLGTALNFGVNVRLKAERRSFSATFSPLGTAAAECMLLFMACKHHSGKVKQAQTSFVLVKVVTALEKCFWGKWLLLQLL